MLLFEQSQESARFQSLNSLLQSLHLLCQYLQLDIQSFMELYESIDVAVNLIEASTHFISNLTKARL